MLRMSPGTLALATALHLSFTTKARKSYSPTVARGVIMGQQAHTHTTRLHRRKRREQKVLFISSQWVKVSVITLCKTGLAFQNEQESHL